MFQVGFSKHVNEAAIYEYSISLYISVYRPIRSYLLYIKYTFLSLGEIFIIKFLPQNRKFLICFIYVIGLEKHILLSTKSSLHK